MASGVNPPPPLPPRRPLKRPTLRQSRIWRGEEITDTIPMVDSLRHTPYRNARVRQAAAEEREARASLDLALRVGELMLRCGAGAPQVESSVIAVAAAAGLDNLEVDITLQSLLVQCTSASGAPITMLRVVRSATRDFARLTAVHEFVENLVAGSYDLEAAAARLREIRRAPRFWPRWAVRGSLGVLSGAVALMLGAGLVASLVAGVSALLVGYAARSTGRRGLPDFYQCAIGGFLATAIAWSAFSMGAGGWIPVSSEEFAFIVAGGITVLLPGRTVASAFEDAISGYSVTGAGRMFGVFLTTAGIILGVATGLSVTLALTTTFDLQLVSPSVMATRALSAPVPLAVIGAFVVGMSGAVSLRSRRNLVVPAGVLSALGVAVSLGVDRLDALGPARRRRCRRDGPRLRGAVDRAPHGGACHGAGRPGLLRAAAWSGDLPRPLRDGQRVVGGRRFVVTPGRHHHAARGDGGAPGDRGRQRPRRVPRRALRPTHGAEAPGPPPLTVRSGWVPCGWL